jgi:large subunit ribosomal protein L9
MEIILKQDIKNLGYADDVVTVRPGYGRNYLIPRGLAVIANDTNKKIHAEVIKQRAHKVAKVRLDVEQLKSMGYSIDKKQIHMPEEHIKKTGTYMAEVVVHRDIRAKLNFEVVEA